ncbi:MAG: S8 family serine peptidase [Bacteroidota bacterium]
MNYKKLALLALGVVLSVSLQAQSEDKAADVPNDQRTHWHHADPNSSDLEGVGTESAYDRLEGKQSRTVVVAIIDSGVDIEHEDLKDKIWVNEDEIPGNGIDDDKNGFVDDIHGWNFLGNADGENIVMANLEATRIYRQYRDKFEGRTASSFSGEELKMYQLYNDARDVVLSMRKEMQGYQEIIDKIAENYNIVEEILAQEFGDTDFSKEDVEALETSDMRLTRAKAFYLALAEDGIDGDAIEKQQTQISERLDYHLNLNYNSREEILDDDLTSLDYGKYGNNDVIGGKEIAEHGTHVAGIVAASRGNELGVEGIATDVQIMVLRTVPNGDEMDKDVANSIRYAVENGAHIINMSFGKSFSPQSEMVAEAIKLAEEKGVLLIHAAGNDSNNNDEKGNYPNDLQTGSSIWVEVGASDAEKGLSMVAEFSNYGFSSVDVFAPGVDIYSTLPSDTYGKRSGTSMASPVVTGVAALIWAYYPELSAAELKEVLTSSAINHGKQKVYRPNEDGKKKKTRFKKLSATGSIINVLEAVKKAETM